MKFVLRTSEVKFAHHFAVRRNFIHKVNFTIEDNFTCPKGKLSFSVFSVKDNTLIAVSVETRDHHRNEENGVDTQFYHRNGTCFGLGILKIIDTLGKAEDSAGKG